MAVNPKVLLETMCKTATPRKERSLRLIYSICEEQHQRGSKDFSIVTIGRLSHEREGPSAASIRNKPGEDYRALLKAFAEDVGGQSRRMAESRQDAVDDVLEGVADPVLRIRIQLLLAENKSLRTQMLGLRHLANNTACIRIEQGGAFSFATPDEPTHAPAQVGPELDVLERRALLAAIAPRTLEHWGWSKDVMGRILSEGGQVVFQAGFVSAIEKILAVE